MLKLATEGHLSMANLTDTYPEWRDHCSDPTTSIHMLPNPAHIHRLLSPDDEDQETDPCPRLATLTALYTDLTLRCPACATPLSKKVFFNTTAHLLSKCSHPSISSFRDKMHTNLGLRLAVLGGPNWWLTQPTSPAPKTRDLPPPTKTR